MRLTVSRGEGFRSGWLRRVLVRGASGEPVPIEDGGWRGASEAGWEILSMFYVRGLRAPDARRRGPAVLVVIVRAVVLGARALEIGVEVWVPGFEHERCVEVARPAGGSY